MTLEPIDRDPPPEFATDELVTAFASVTSQIKSALSDPALRRLLMANRDSLLKACETALVIETALDDASVLTAAE